MAQPPMTMDFSPAGAAWDYLMRGPQSVFGEPYGGVNEVTRPTDAERKASMPKAIPYNPSLGEQNYPGAVGVPHGSPILRMLFEAPPTPAPPPANSTDAAAAVPWVEKGGQARDFYNPDRGPAKPLVGTPVGPPQMMPEGVRNAIKSSATPWEDLGGSSSDFYDPNSLKELARQQTNEQMAKIRRINAINAPPSWSTIEQTMQNSAMGYAPEIQAAFLHDMVNRAQGRLGASAKAIGDVLGMDVGMQQADVQGQQNLMQSAAQQNALNAQLGYEMLKQEDILPPEVAKKLREMLLARILIGR